MLLKRVPNEDITDYFHKFFNVPINWCKYVCIPLHFAVRLEKLEWAQILPEPNHVFKCLQYRQPDEVKVVIIGQDPYPDEEYASGLAFSSKTNGIPWSLKNIFKELVADVGIEQPTSGNLENWAKQGVLLLNDVLTVQDNLSGSHRGFGWEGVTTGILKELLALNKPLVVIAWGKPAAAKIANLITENDVHTVIYGGHPSPRNMKSNFLGGKYFSKANNFLIKHGIEPIDWSIK